MPALFISYARQDAPRVEPFAQQLTEQGIQVWRDQTSLYAGQQWPKAIGEAIAAHDGVVLIWSNYAAQSHFVECEWNMALALRKTIIPVLFDATPLPAALRALNAIAGSDIEAACGQIFQALQQPAPETDPADRTTVLERLGTIVPSSPAQVAQELKRIVNHQGWQVQGNVYQAAGDIHIRVDPSLRPAEKKPLEKWSVRAGLVVAVLTSVALLLDIPKKFVETFESGVESREVVQPLEGVIWGEGREFLAGVEVILPEFNKRVVTDHNGRFAFEVTAPKQRSVNLVAKKGGYVTFDADPTLGNTSLHFTLRKKP